MKYYCRKPKGEIVKDLLGWLLVAGAVMVAATSPYFLHDILQAWGKQKRYRQKSVENAFQRMQKTGLLAVQKRGYQYEVSLTAEGKKRAGWLHVDELAIPKPKHWDGVWRFLMFDVKQTQRWKRDVLRSFLRRLGFVQFQKSVWVHPYDCKGEVGLLKALLDLGVHEMQLIVATDIGGDEVRLRKHFRIDL